MTSTDARELRFVTPSPQEYLRALRQAVAEGRRVFQLDGDEAEVSVFSQQARLPEGAELIAAGASPPRKPDTVILFGADAMDVSKRLARRAAGGGLVIAPVTAHHCRHRPAFINSIPKSGTHLLIELMRAFGLSDPPRLDMPDTDGPFRGGTFYNLQHMTLHALARPYAQIQPLVHALDESVVVFIHRDPRDVAVSMAHYLAAQNEYHVLQHYFEALGGREQRLAAVIEGRYPVPVFINRHLSFGGNLRELVRLYEPWLRNPPANTCVVRFEDLVGSAGGGNDAAQHDAVWQLQLALHVPGRPEELAQGIFSPTAATFRAGQIGSHQREFTPRHWQSFQALKLDFVQPLVRTDGPVRCIPEGFQGCLNLDLPQAPSLIEADYRGYDIVHYRQAYHALVKGNPLDLSQVNPAELKPPVHFEDPSLGRLEQIVDHYVLDREIESLRAVSAEVRHFWEQYRRSWLVRMSCRLSRFFGRSG